MSREWKLGEVAELSIDGQTAIGIVRAHRDDSVPVWVISGHSFFKSIAVGNDVLIQDVRPLVVIDPEDREAVERLLSGYAGWRDSGAELPSDYPEYIDLMQAALREFANPTPPAPVEPTDPAVRVADRDGDLWARIGDKWVNNQGGKSVTWAYVVEHYSPLEVQS